MAVTENAPTITRWVASAVRAFPTPWQKPRIANQIGKLVVRGRGSMPVIGRMQAGYAMHLDLQDTFQRVMYFAGTYEPGATRLFQRVLQPGDTVIDGGANIGYFTLLAAQCVGQAGSVHSFEPIPNTCQALEANVALNGFSRVRLNCLALSDRSGTLEFEVPVDTSNGRQLGWAATQVIMGRGPKIAVRATTLDEYAIAQGIDRIRLVKLDLEGGELAAIAGMQRLLSERRIAYLITEVNSFLLDPLGIPHNALRNTLTRFGYRCFEVRDGAFGRPKLVDPATRRRPDEDAEYLFVLDGAPIPE